MVHRGGNVLDYVSWKEMDRIDQLLAATPPHISIMTDSYAIEECKRIG